jgi:molybdate transport system substrate-binding protein
MMRSRPSSQKDWSVGLRVWLERAGQAILGPGRAALLEAIQRCHSISAAARDLRISYRHAWVLVQAINEAAGEPLVSAATGGTHGGGAILTPAGQHALAVYHQLREALDQSASALLPRIILQQPAQALHLVAAASLEQVLSQLLPDFAEGHTGLRVRTIYGASDELADRLLTGSPADLFLSADPHQLDRLESQGLLSPGTRRPLAENSLAAIGRDETMRAVRTAEAMARQDSLRLVLADPATPLGAYTRAYLTERGLFERMLAHATVVDNSRAVVTAVQRGCADAGVVYGSDAVWAGGCRVLFRVRRRPGQIRYEAAVLRQSGQQEAARQLLDFLITPSATECFRRCGFLPSGA